MENPGQGSGVRMGRSPDFGMTVENERGDAIGVVETILEIPDNHVFVVRKGTEEVLIPAAKSFVTSVDLQRRRMMVRGIDDLAEDRHAV